MVCGLLPSLSWSATPFSDRYDREITAAVAQWWPSGPGWLWWKAQLYQESRLNPAAVSPVGAAGLAQFMPGTWREVAREMRLPPGASPNQAIAISAGAYYMAKLAAGWKAERSVMERHILAQAAYNAGLGNILAAQKRCGNARNWPEIAPCLPLITGRHAAETTGYVQQIARWRSLMGVE